MLIFGSDDNDDNLDWDDKSADDIKPNPSPSLPSRPVSKSPFGSDADQVDDLSPAKKVEAPLRRPTSPFGQTSKPVTPPLNPLTGVQRPSQAAPERITPPVFAKPPVGASTPPTPPMKKEPSSYSSFVPKIPSQPEETLTEQVEPQSEALNEAELFLKSVKEQAEQRSATAKMEEAAAALALAEQRAKELALDAENKKLNAEPAVETKKTRKKKQGFFSPPPKKSNTQPVKEKKYDGERKKILYVRLVAGSVAAIIAITGLNATFNPSKGPTKEMMMSAAQEALNYTGFPTLSGEQFAMDFSRAYFNFDSKDQTREESLSRFASDDLISQIDIETVSAQEYDSVKKEDITYSDYVVTQSISYGPYVVSSKNIDAKNAIFTTKVGLKSGTVVYLDVPVKYDPDNYALTLAGPPSFSKPIQNQGTTMIDEWTVTFEGGNDDDIAESFESDLQAYMSAWALSDSTLINRLVLEKATDNARKGLQGAVIFNKIVELHIEPLDESRPSTETSRRVEVRVMWEDPTTGLRYPQQYRMLIGLNPDNKWAVYDIQNFSVLN